MCVLKGVDVKRGHVLAMSCHVLCGYVVECDMVMRCDLMF